MIDVHVAKSVGYNVSWWEECEDSLRSDHPITVHHLPGVPGDIRKMRLMGFECGTSEFVSFVDPDDVVLPDAFNQLATALTNNPHVCGAYSLSMRVDDVGGEQGLVHPYRKYSPHYLTKHPLEIHQLVVMRRECVLSVMHEHYDIIPQTGLTELVLYALMALKAPWIAVNHVGYKWRLHSTGSHKSPYDWDEQRKLMKSLCNQLIEQNK